MYDVKMVAGLACGITALLLVLALTTKNPDTIMYEKTVEMLMEQEGTTSEKVIEERYPVLVDIQSNMKRIAVLHRIILSKTQGPAPMITEKVSEQIDEYMCTIRQLRKWIMTELSLLNTTHSS